MFPLFLFSQDFFQPTLVTRDKPNSIEPDQSIYEVDFTNLWQWVNKDVTPELVVPVDNQAKIRFVLQPTAILAPALAARYPSIRTFQGYSGHHRIQCVITPEQFQAYLFDGEQTSLIETKQNQVVLGVMSSWMRAGETFPCTVIENGSQRTTLTNGSQEHLEIRDPQVEPMLRTYRLAIATTGEFSAKYGNTRASVLAAVTSIISNVNAVMERELSIRLQLVDGTDQLFFLDPLSDPFTNGQPDSLLLQAPFAINAVINTNDYDIGHVLGTNAGGVAFLGTVCTAGKANATSSTFGVYSSNLFYLIVAHEMGHQLNATHSFNFCEGDNETSETAYEPGSGSTIMCYAGASNCGSNYVSNRNEEYYHTAALNQITTFTRQGIGATCGIPSDLVNTPPRVTLLNFGFTHVPKSTPMQLSGEGVDDEDNSLTYCWEEYDLGPQSPLGDPKGDAPAFRSYAPTSEGTRTLPNLNDLLLGIDSRTEVLPDYSRNLKFRLTVRDNHPGGGQVAWQELNFKVDGNAGPFLVTSPSSGTSWSNDRYQLVTWDVANTDNSQVNCQGVRILLSTDGGHHHDIVLADATENDGSEYVLIPDGIETSAGNIKVESISNVFFNLSKGTFQLKSDNLATWTFGVTPNSLKMCMPGTEFIDIETKSSNGFSDPISISWPEELPTGLQLSADQTTIAPDGSFHLQLNANYQTLFQDTTIMLTLSSGVDVRTIPIRIHLTPSDFSSLSLMTPADETTGSGNLPRLSWSEVPDADFFWVELSEDPGFGIVVLRKLSYVNFYDVTTPLVNSTVYYWRITPANDCRSGDPSIPFAFQTKTQTCQEYTNSTPVIGGRQAESLLTIPDGITPTDVNVLNLKGMWQLVGNLTFSLLNPLDSTVTLVKGKCANLSNFDFGFDDQSSLTLTCPLTSQKIFKPETPLAKMNGIPAGGDWKLRIVDNGGNSGGSIDQWTLALCFDDVLNPPLLIGTDTLKVSPSIGVALNPDLLTVTDADQGPGELQVHILSTPLKGRLEFNGQALEIGSSLSLLQLLDGSTRYTYTSVEAGLDSVVVSILDGQGGWIPRATVYFSSDAGVGVPFVTALPFQIYPNPARDRFHLKFEEPIASPSLHLMDALGRRVWHQAYSGSVRTLDLDMPSLSSGMYFLQVNALNQSGIQKIIIQTP